MRPQLRLLTLLSLALLSGCGWLAPPAQPRGNIVNQAELAKLVVGKTTQSEAQALLGSPTAKGTFDQNVWNYVGQMTRPQIGGTNQVLAQDVVELRFNDQGVLQSVRHLNKAQALAAPMIARTTPSPGTEASFLQQLFGNVGKFNPGLGSQGPTAGAPVAR
ncbi:MAG TPA: outer membrane protein assembly factor BamE [Acetobacteraceae bacterium]|nr:outer membrane protein assembly factor BamE [Acetobacteraceae bacterium]